MQSTTPPNKHFGLDSIKRSLKYFVIGKGMNAFLSMAILFSLAGFMQQADYAAFVSWQALVMLVGLLASFGLQAVMHRFLPELRSQNNNLIVYRLLIIGIGLRVVVMLSIVLLLISNLPFLSAVLKIPEVEGLLAWFLLIGVLRITALSMSQAFDSLLWQRSSQFSLVASNISRIGLILAAYFYGEVTILNIVIIEFIAELVFLICLSSALFKRWRNDVERAQGEPAWWHSNRRRVVNYGASKYLVNLSKVFYGSAPNRLLAAQFVAVKEVAILGFADSIMRLAMRFMPAILMIGFIRPVFVARYSTGSEFSSLVRMSNAIFRINMATLVFLIVGVIVVGEPVFGWLTKGKYGDANWLIAGFFALLIFEGLRMVLELLIEVTELNKISILSNLVQSGSLLLAIPLFYFIGLWSIVVANLSGTILACVICIIQLTRHDFSVRFELKLVGLIIIHGLLTWLAGSLSYQWFDSIILSVVAMTGTYAGLMYLLPPLEKSELNQLLKLVKKKK